MSIGIARLTAFIVIVSATASLLVGTGAVIEQVVKAQNMTTNTTHPGGNITGTDDGSGEISARRDMVCKPPDCG